MSERPEYQLTHGDGSIWRPLRLPVQDWPLAICDAATVDQSDLVPSDYIHRDYIAENLLVHFNENQRWYWLPNQAENEIFLFKAVDSDYTEGGACECS